MRGRLSVDALDNGRRAAAATKDQVQRRNPDATPGPGEGPARFLHLPAPQVNRSPGWFLYAHNRLEETMGTKALAIDRGLLRTAAAAALLGLLGGPASLRSSRARNWTRRTPTRSASATCSRSPSGRTRTLTTTVPVRPDGRISVPLLGDVQAAGMTPLALKQSLTDGYKEYVTAPGVSVVVKEIHSRKIFVTGEVAHPGTFDLEPRTKLMQALALAGGSRPTPRGGWWCCGTAGTAGRRSATRSTSTPSSRASGRRTISSCSPATPWSCRRLSASLLSSVCQFLCRAGSSRPAWLLLWGRTGDEKVSEASPPSDGGTGCSTASSIYSRSN